VNNSLSLKRQKMQQFEILKLLARLQEDFRMISSKHILISLEKEFVAFEICISILLIVNIDPQNLWAANGL